VCKPRQGLFLPHINTITRSTLRNIFTATTPLLGRRAQRRRLGAQRPILVSRARHERRELELMDGLEVVPNSVSWFATGSTAFRIDSPYHFSARSGFSMRELATKPTCAGRPPP
jgi:hypothetical protein